MKFASVQLLWKKKLSMDQGQNRRRWALGRASYSSLWNWYAPWRPINLLPFPKCMNGDSRRYRKPQAIYARSDRNGEPSTAPSSFGSVLTQSYGQAELALSSDETPVGCVFVRNGEIIGRGMNDTNRSMNVCIGFFNSIKDYNSLCQIFSIWYVLDLSIPFSSILYPSHISAITYS